MAKNYIPEIAKMLGVEIGEEFAVLDMVCFKKYDGYRFSEDALLYHRENIWEKAIPGDLCGILKGTYEIVKKPWKPKKSNIYWFVTAYHGVLHSIYDPECWSDIMTARIGNCYRTREEAEADREKWERFYADDSRINWEEGTTHE